MHAARGGHLWQAQSSGSVETSTVSCCASTSNPVHMGFCFAPGQHFDREGEGDGQGIVHHVGQHPLEEDGLSGGARPEWS